MATINDTTGLTPASFEEILSDAEDSWRVAIGDNARTGPESVFGQLMNIIALLAAESNELAEYVDQAFNPQTASGTALSELVLLAGIQRQESAYSTVTLTCTANAAGSTIPAGALVSDPSAQIQWQTNAQVVVAPSSTNTVTATATESGPYEASAGTITQIDTPYYGWTAVTNLSAANVGRTEESDGTLRLRYQSTVDSSSTVSAGAIFRAVSDVDSVDAVKVHINNTGTTDAYSVPGHSIWTIVDGGTNADVAEAIYDHTAGGIGWYGSTTVVHQDPESGDTYSVKFSRPSDIAIYIDVVVVPDEDFPTDGFEQIETAIINHVNALGLGDDVLVSRLYTPINAVAGHYVSSLTLGFSASPTGTSNLAIDLDERAVTDATKVSVSS